MSEPEAEAQPFPRSHTSVVLAFRLRGGQAHAMHAGSRSTAESLVKTTATAEIVSKRD